MKYGKEFNVFGFAKVGMEIKKTHNPSLHPIAARWAAPGELFVTREINMKSVFILFHTHHMEDGEEDEKLLGVYSSRELAAQKIENKYKKLPGFCEAGGVFIIDEYKIDQDHWEEGFITVKSEK